MMTFDEFKEWSKDHIKDYLPEGLSGAEVRVHRITKPGLSYDSLTVRDHSNTAVPAVNLDEMYSRYLSGYSLQEVGEAMAITAQIDTPNVDMNVFNDYDEARKRLFLRVNNAAANRELLSKVPHEMHGDMAVTYHISLGQEGGALTSTIINYDLLNALGIPEDQLRKDAHENSKTIMPARVESLPGMIGMGDETPGKDLLVLTNDMRINGASALFYPDVMDTIGDRIGSFYVCPSSIHEMIIVPESASNARDLGKILHSVNESFVRPEEKLSDTVYHFDAQNHQFEIAESYELRKEKELRNDFDSDFENTQKYRIDLNNNSYGSDGIELNLKASAPKFRM